MPVNNNSGGSPAYKREKMEDFTILAPDVKRARKFLYHKSKKPMIVYSDNDDYKKFYAEGWEDTPAAFFNMKAHGVPEDKMPELHKEMDDIKDMVNDEINLDAMFGDELRVYAKKYLPGLKLHWNLSDDKARDMIKKAKAEAEKIDEDFINAEIGAGNDDSIKAD
jgi:hypothetical protein